MAEECLLMTDPIDLASQSASAGTPDPNISAPQVPEAPAGASNVLNEAAQPQILGGSRGIAPKLPKKLDVRLVAGAVLIVAAILLLGYGFVSQSPAGNGNAPVAPAPIPAPPVQTENNTVGNASTLENATVAPIVEVDPFAGITPRNVSDKISDGQFRVLDDSSAQLKVYVINDGFADSILVNKGNFYMLLDAGNFTPADKFLKSMNISRINVLVASRDYEGAINGMGGILDSYTVDEFWDNNVVASENTVVFVQQSSQYAALLSKVEAKGIAIKHPQAGDNMTVSNLAVAVLNPQKNRYFGNPDADSIVLKISNGAFCMLFLNPTVQETENSLLGTGEKLRCDVITYFKHGEGRPTASLLVENYALPKDAIISVGPNADGLPSQTTLTRLQLRNVNVWDTENGTVSVTNDGISSKYTIAQVS
jgi:competence protein ComEC